MILVVYSNNTKEGGSMKLDFRIDINYFNILLDFQNNPILVLCIILIALTIASIVSLFLMKALKCFNKGKEAEN